MATPALADPQVVGFRQLAEIQGTGGVGTIDYTVSALHPSGHNDGVFYSDPAVDSYLSPDEAMRRSPSVEHRRDAT
jgi:hypothetical protein